MFKGNFKPIAFLTALALLIGLPIIVFTTQQQTGDQQHASYQDLNTGDQISQANNQDGTMGPPDWTGNYANAIDPSQTGTLTFLVTDPEQTGKPTGFPIYNQVPTYAIHPQAQTVNNQPQVTNSTVTHAPTPTGTQTALTPTLPITTLTPTPELNNPGGGPQAVSSLMITIDKVEVHTVHSSNDVWETLNIGGTKTVDLVQLSKGGFATLGLTKLAAGQYTEVRLYITNASAKLTDGTSVPISIPGKFNIVRINRPFDIVAGVNTNITMDFDAQNSVIKAGYQTVPGKAGDQYKLKPVIANFLVSTPDITAGPSIHPSITAMVTPPPGCHYQVCTLACPVNNPNCCPHILICPSGTIAPKPTCLLRPPCLDATPRCLIPEPIGGWCPSSITPHPTVSVGVGTPSTCIPRPACLDTTPKCNIPEPAGGWCPAPTGGQTPPTQENALILYLNNLLRHLLGR